METIQEILSAYGDFLLNNWAWQAMTFVLAGLVIGSGSFAGSVAEARNRNRLLHLLAGCLVPVIYPVAVFYLMTYREKQVKERRVKEEHEQYERTDGAPPPDAPPLVDEAMAPPEVTAELLGKANVGYDQAFFKQMTYDEKGNYRGPFLFVVNDEEFKVERIVSALDNVVVIENLSSDGKTQRLRIPYKRVQSCTELE